MFSFIRSRYVADFAFPFLTFSLATELSCNQHFFGEASDALRHHVKEDYTIPPCTLCRCGLHNMLLTHFVRLPELEMVRFLMANFQASDQLQACAVSTFTWTKHLPKLHARLSVHIGIRRIMPSAR
jgi:hypothetical protein